MENHNLKTAQINPSFTEWIVLVWSIKYVATVTNEFLTRSTTRR